MHRRTSETLLTASVFSALPLPTSYLTTRRASSIRTSLFPMT